MTLVEILRPVVRCGHAEPDVGSQPLAFSVQNGCDAFLRTSSQISGTILEPFLLCMYCGYILYLYCNRAACTTVL